MLIQKNWKCIINNLLIFVSLWKCIFLLIVKKGMVSVTPWEFVRSLVQISVLNERRTLVAFLLMFVFPVVIQRHNNYCWHCCYPEDELVRLVTTSWNKWKNNTQKLRELYFTHMSVVGDMYILVDSWFCAHSSLARTLVSWYFWVDSNFDEASSLMF